MQEYSSTSRRGFGALLIVVLLGLAIVLFLMFGNFGGKGGYMQQVGNARTHAKETVRDINTQQISIVIAQYRQSQGALPTSIEDLEIGPAGKDQWGKDLAISFEEVRTGPTKVTYRSAGPDGEMNTEDDIVKTEALPF